MPIQPVDLEKLKHQTTNVYELTVAMSRRSKEINESLRSELEEKLAPFKAKTRNPANENEADKVYPEQVGISVKYERLAKPTKTSITEYSVEEYTYDYREVVARKGKSKE
jgi:hypothetical protein